MLPTFLALKETLCSGSPSSLHQDRHREKREQRRQTGETEVTQRGETARLTDIFKETDRQADRKGGGVYPVYRDPEDFACFY